LEDRSNLFFHGVISRREIALALNQADILVNIGNNSALQLPSKIIEYIFYEKPILNFVSIKNDSSLKTMKDYPALTIYKKNKIISKRLVDKIEKFLTHPPVVSNRYKKSIIENHSLEKISSLYKNIFLHESININKKLKIR
jgi:hypothetical protein